jgi:hypothetical protein
LGMYKLTIVRFVETVPVTAMYDASGATLNVAPYVPTFKASKLHV